MKTKEIVDKLTVYEKYNIYFHYMSVQLGLKHNFEIVPINTLGWGKADKCLKTVGLHFIWKNINMDSFEEFLKDGIYSWYNKFFMK